MNAKTELAIEHEAVLPTAKAADPMQLLSIAVSQGADIDKLEKLMELQERWEANNARKAFDAAISAARAEIKPIVKTATVDFTSQKGRTHYKHETLDAIATQVDPILSAHGLSYRFRSRQESGAVCITCILSHKDGHSEETELSGPPDMSGNKNSYQAVGSAATYLQRYTLKLALGLSAAKDDDGGGAGGADNQPRLTNGQISQLRKAMSVAGIDESALCARVKINRIEELQQARFDGAMNWLQEKAFGGAQ